MNRLANTFRGKGLFYLRVLNERVISSTDQLKKQTANFQFTHRRKRVQTKEGTKLKIRQIFPFRGQRFNLDVTSKALSLFFFLSSDIFYFGGRANTGNGRKFKSGTPKPSLRESSTATVKYNNLSQVFCLRKLLLLPNLVIIQDRRESKEGELFR